MERHLRTVDSAFMGRIIPAQAGNAQHRPRRGKPRPDHPRASGERFLQLDNRGSYFGSSPRRRGTRRQGPQVTAENRIIPAQAGNAISCAVAAALMTDHPRAGGERWIRGGDRPVWDGSSPRRRGTLVEQSASCPSSRIIPAQAGNARPPPRRPTGLPDHPRAGGERATWAGSRPSNAGSSPRRRGTLFARAPDDAAVRIIPAQAGNALPADLTDEQKPDHPRAGGERRQGKRVFVPVNGSSPRRRGTLGRDQ